MFDASITSASELVDIRVANAISGVTGVELSDPPGAFGLVGEGADKPYAVLLEAEGIGAYVQSNSQDVAVEALVAIVRSILDS